MINTNKNITFVSPPLLGHTMQLLSLAEELVSRGYQVDFILSEQFQEIGRATGANILLWETQIPNTLWNELSKQADEKSDVRLYLEFTSELYANAYRSLEPLLEQCKPDLLVLDRGVFQAMDWAHTRNIPFILHTEFFYPYQRKKASYPELSWSRKLLARAEDTVIAISSLFALLAQWRRVKEIQKIRRSFNNPIKNTFNDKLLLVGTAYGVEIPRSLPANIQIVGPIMPKTSRPIEGELEAWLDSASKCGIIYISFGTLADLSPKFIQHVVKAVANIPRKVLWSIQEKHIKHITEKPPNIRFEKFVSQESVIRHPATKLVVTHCGMNTVNEALYYGKPILGVPFFSDQYYNAARVENMGAGIALNKNNVTDTAIKESISKLLEDRSYAATAEKMSFIMQKYHGRERAADLIEIALTTGIQHLVTGNVNHRPDSINTAEDTRDTRLGSV